MPSGVNNVPSTDLYTDTVCDFERASEKVNLIVANASVLIQWESPGVSGRGSGQWNPAEGEQLVPGVYSKVAPQAGPVTGARVKSFTPGLSARVTIRAA